MATQSNNKSKSGGSWKKERASVSRRDRTKTPRSNKYRPSSDGSQRPEPGTTERYWRAGYTRKDGTKVKGHYVNKASR